MKKLLISIVTVLAIVSGGFSFAADAKLSGYYSSQHPSTALSTKSLKSKQPPFTDIAIYNYSADVIFANVPGAIYDVIYPNNNDHIYNDNDAIYWTHLRLLDPNRNTFFERDVCHRAIVSVSGYPGSYTVNVNSNGCF